MAAAIKKVHIFENEGEFIVYPATTQLDASNNDEIEFVNHTDQDAVFYFGPGLVDTDGFAEAVPKNKPKKKKAKQSSPGNFRISSYQVILLPSCKRAKANSDPVIIIDN
jgi:hypothetical protein